MIKLEDIAQHLALSVPQWIYDLKEFRTIYEALAPFVVELRNEAEKLQGNQFIFECNKNGLTRYENMHGLVTDTDDDIRKINLYNYYNSNCNFTIKWFKNYMDSVFGKGAWAYTLADYHLTIIVNSSKFYLYDAVLKDLRAKIPANIGLDVYESDKIENTMYAAGIIRDIEEIKI